MYIYGADNDYCNRVKDLLERTDTWKIVMEILYSRLEAHAITSNKGDTSKLTIFSDNSEKTVYEFFDALELCMMGWGTGRQRARIECPVVWGTEKLTWRQVRELLDN